MYKLYGFPVSNYTNMVELALLEKGLRYEYVAAFPGQTAETLAKSPRGKVPFLETPDGFINETFAILEYLEERGEGKPMLPAEPYARAQVRALMREIELYIELPARSCFVGVFFGGPLPDAIKAKARDDLTLGAATLQRHGRFAPYVAGDTFTLADIVFLHTVELAGNVAQQLFGIDLLGDMPAARALLQRLNAMPNVQGMAKRRDAAMPGFIATMQARFRSAG